MFSHSLARSPISLRLVWFRWVPFGAAFGFARAAPRRGQEAPRMSGQIPNTKGALSLRTSLEGSSKGSALALRKTFGPRECQSGIQKCEPSKFTCPRQIHRRIHRSAVAAASSCPALISLFVYSHCEQAARLGWLCLGCRVLYCCRCCCHTLAATVFLS